MARGEAAKRRHIHMDLMAFLAALAGQTLSWEGFPKKKGPPEGKMKFLVVGILG